MTLKLREKRSLHRQDIEDYGNRGSATLSKAKNKTNLNKNKNPSYIKLRLRGVMYKAVILKTHVCLKLGTFYLGSQVPL